MVNQPPGIGANAGVSIGERESAMARIIVLPPGIPVVKPASQGSSRLCKLVAWQWTAKGQRERLELPSSIPTSRSAVPPKAPKQRIIGLNIAVARIATMPQANQAFTVTQP